MSQFPLYVLVRSAPFWRCQESLMSALTNGPRFVDIETTQTGGRFPPPSIRCKEKRKLSART